MPTNCFGYLCTKDSHGNIMTVIAIIKFSESLDMMENEEKHFNLASAGSSLRKRFSLLLNGKYKCLFLALLNNLKYRTHCQDAVYKP